MLEILPSPNGVTAMRFSGKFEHEDVEKAKAFFERRFADGEKIHLFIEVDSFTGIDVKVLPGYLASVAPFLTKLDHLGRVAIVSDAAWVRSLARVESALLPHVHYETFLSSERDQALAWVEGRSPLARRVSVTIIETDSPNVVGFGIDGRCSAAELKALVDHFEDALRQERMRRVLGRLQRFDGVAIGGILQSEVVDMKRRSFSQVERFAIVGGPGWLTGWMSALDSVLKMQIRHFELSDEASAWAWLGAQPVSERPVLPS
ncbi:MAG: STAS/SEC14 domain-containing protein [Chloroflexi bacterium]|nr:STAS/SEC14 domain-containing protein [Chloroflexota bacterium]